LIDSRKARVYHALSRNNEWLADSRTRPAEAGLHDGKERDVLGFVPKEMFFTKGVGKNTAENSPL
jgi:hypothetical protein